MGFAASSMYPGRYVHTMYQRPASYVALGNVASRLSSSGIATWTISSRPPRVVITWGQWRLGSGWLATLLAWPRCGGCFFVGKDCLCWMYWHCRRRRRLMLAFGPRLHLHYWLCDSQDMQPLADSMLINSNFSIHKSFFSFYFRMLPLNGGKQLKLYYFCAANFFEINKVRLGYTSIEN